MVKTGIYKIQSLKKPERAYVGSAVNVVRRWYQHLHQLRNGKHHCIKLQRHYDVHGESDLAFVILHQCVESGLLQCEQNYIDDLRPYFNTAPTAGSQAGLRHTEEAKRKISAAKKGSDFWTGRKHKEESKEKMRAAKLGRKLSSEHRAKLSAAKIGNRNTVGNKNRLGKTFTPEVRRRISESLKRYFADRKATC